MAIVTGKKQHKRVIAAHVFLWVLIAIMVFPLLAIISISLRPGNFASGSLIPTNISFEHWSWRWASPTRRPTAAWSSRRSRCCAGSGTRSRSR